MIIALHGLLDSPEVFRDLRGEIISPRIPQNRRTLKSRAAWLEDWLQAKGIRDFHLLGHSLGGALAVSAAANTQPRSLMLIAPVGFGPVRFADLLRGPLRGPLRTSAPLLLGFSPLIRATYRHLFTVGGEMPESLQKELQRDPRGALRRAEREMDIVHELDRHPFESINYRGPVAALWGERDHLVPPKAQEPEKVLPQTKRTILPSVGHDPIREKGTLVDSWISSHIKEHDGQNEQTPHR